jgi:gliding motility-associated protein GldL
MWNSNRGKKIISAAYSLGASVVILGALFKILHLPGANYMLMAGMITESVIFALGIFDTPHKDYDWGQIFDFKNPEKLNLTTSGVQSLANTTSVAPARHVGLNYTETISDDEVKKLSEGIKNLSATADNLQVLANVAVAANGLTKNIETAAEATVNFAGTQQKLNTTSETLAAKYQGITSEMDVITNTTKSYADKVAEVNKSLASINSIYEIQLRHIQSQTEGLNLQSENIRTVSGHLDDITSDILKMKEATALTLEDSLKYQVTTKKIAKQVEDLNAVYGNMLNALS